MHAKSEYQRGEGGKMTDLGDVLTKIGEEFKDEIWAKSGTYCLIDVGKAFEVLGKENADNYKGVNAVVPLKKSPEKGIPFLVNGKDLSDYCQLESGIAVPEWMAEESGLTHKPYKPKDSMVLYM